MNWIVLIFAAASLGVILTDLQPVWIQTTVFAVALALFLFTLVQRLSSPQHLQQWLKRRSVLFLLIPFLIVINLVAREHDRIYDLSKARLYALREETVSWLQKLTEPVHILIFLQRDDKTFPYAEWLRRQTERQTDRVTVEIRNINRDIGMTKRYGIRQTGETVLLSGDQWVKVGSFKEDVIVPGLVRLLAKGEDRLCFLTGHGEADIEDTRPEGLRGVKNLLQDLGYRTEAISLIEERSVQSAGQTPVTQGCTLLAIISPKLSFLPQEVERLRKMEEAGVPFLIAADPPASGAVVDWFVSHGLRPSDHPVVDRENVERRFLLTDILIHPTLPHPVTGNLSRSLYLPETQSFQVETGNGVSLLLQTPAGDRFGELDRKTEGPFVLALAMEKAPEDNQPRSGVEGGATRAPENNRPQRYLILGTGKGFQTRHLQFGDNQQFLLSAVRWLLDEKDLEMLQLRVMDERYIELNPAEQSWVRIFSLYLFPAFGFLVVCSLWAWRVRTR